MNQKYKLYVNNAIIYICKNPANIVTMYMDAKEFIYIDIAENNSIKNTLSIAYNEINKSDIILFGEHPEAILKAFLQEFVVIESAGGLVINQNKQILLIYRRGSWDMPKGKIEKNEGVEAAAIREVQEETGLKNVLITSKIVFKDFDNIATYHAYDYKGKRAMKVAFWYMMKTSDENLVPQLEEDIEEAKWVYEYELQEYYTKMYPSIQDVLKAVF
jgi:ADP-ribose pyrophosphatase YjhB (NUDIX family)